MTPPSRHAAQTVTHTRSWRVPLTPSRDDVVEAGLVFLLAALALIGFRTTFTGWHYFIAGLVGTVLGIALGHLANVLRQPMIAVATMAVGVFFLLGGAVALRGSAIGGILPSGGTLHGLADESVHGWTDLVTTLPPVDGDGPLLVLPYILGLFAGVGGFCVARRTRPAFAPVAAPFAVLIAVILLGVQTPAERILQGAVFGTVSLGWAALRSQRLRPAANVGDGRTTRLLTVAVLLVLAGSGALLVGPHLPGAGSHKRTVLRSYVQPPVNLDQYPSPLAGFRRYVEPASNPYAGLRDVVLFTVHGLPAGTPIRIATLDDYNGTVWTATNRPLEPGSPPDNFQRVGPVIDDPSPGKPVTFTVQVPSSGYSDVWLPDAGAVTAVAFHGTDAAGHSTYFRYNLATGTGLLPDRLRPGDSYTVHAILPPTEVPAGAAPAGADPTLSGEASFLSGEATALSGTASDPMARVLAIAQALRSKGFYSDGLTTSEQQYVPGHFESRLVAFLRAPQIVGNDEQYAAAFALLANQVGVPARVVFGAIPVDGVVRGQNVRAWVEVQLTDGSWRTIPDKTFMPDRSKKPKTLLPQQQQPVQGQIVPPPVTSRPRTDQLAADDANTQSTRATKKKNAAHKLPSPGWELPSFVIAAGKYAGPPLGLVLGCAALIIGLKAARRRGRRTRGSPATRVARGWSEIVDRARDLGTSTAPVSTRREQGVTLDRFGVSGLARWADSFVFGPRPPAADEAAAYWTEVDRVRVEMGADLGWWRRVRAALSIASLRTRSRAAPEAPG